MFTTIKDFKLYKESNYNSLTNDMAIPIEKIANNMDLVKKYAEYARSLELSKANTIGIVKNVFTDPRQAPKEISVDFVVNNLESIIDYLDKIPDIGYSELDIIDDIKNKDDLPFECIMKVNNSKEIIKLYEQLKQKIKNDDFQVKYDNNVFYINNLDLLSENNVNIVLSTLKKHKAINITEQVKWLRKI